MEIYSLVTEIWKILRTRSFIENYAVLLKNAGLCSQLIIYHPDGFKEMATLLQLTEPEMKWIIRQVPLEDIDISGFLLDTFEIKAGPGVLRTARRRALRDLQKTLSLDLKAVKRKKE